MRELANTPTDNEVNGMAFNRNYSSEEYAETMSLIAMVVAGFSMSPTGSEGRMQTSSVWSNACERLLLRPDIASADHTDSRQPHQGIKYLKAICTFLLNIGDGFTRTIHDEGLSLADRIG